MEFLLSGIVLGLMGSLHCAVMCGPIALALPIGRSGKYTSHLLHQSGRVLTYAILGAIVGTLGAGISFAGWQQPLSIAVGILLLAGLVSKWPTLLKWGPYRRFYGKLQTAFGTKLKGAKGHRFLITGMINGLLPCGLVYAALIGALGIGNTLDGVWMMVGFGIGTGPLLLIIGWSGPFIIEKLRGKVRFAIPVVVSLMATFFILRGMGLSIPYISPGDQSLTTQTVQGENHQSCH